MNQIGVERYSGEKISQWDLFVSNSNNGTIFHKQRFLGYHSPDKFRDHSLIFFRGSSENISAVFPAAEVKRNNQNALESHPGSSYGGLVLKTAKISEINCFFDELESYCLENGFQCCYLRPAPLVFQKRQNQSLEFIMAQRGYRPISIEQTNAICLFDNSDLFGKMKKTTRTAIRKAIKVELDWSEVADTREFYAVLTNNLETSHHIKPTHSFDELKRLRNLFPQEIKLFGAYYEHQLAAGIGLFICNRIAAHTFYLCSDEDLQHLRPLNFLLWKIAKHLQDRGFKYLNLGISTEQGGKIINWGLFKFKESFGAEGFLRIKWQKQFS